MNDIENGDDEDLENEQDFEEIESIFKNIFNILDKLALNLNLHFLCKISLKRLMPFNIVTN